MAYNLLDLQTSLQDDLKDPSFSTSRLTRYLNYGQTAIFNKRLLKFAEKSFTQALTVGVSSLAQQTDWQATIGGVLKDPANNNRTFNFDSTTYLTSHEFFLSYPDPTTSPQGLPVAWTEYGTTLYFNCPVDKAYNFTQRYYRTPTALSASTDVPAVPEYAREALETYALARAEAYRGNKDYAKELMSTFDELLEDFSGRVSGNQLGSATMLGDRVRTSA